MRLRLLKDIAARKVWTLIFARISKMIQIPTQTSPQPEGKFWRKIRSFFSSSSLPQPLSKSIKRFLTIYGDEDSGIQVYNTFDPASTSVMVRAFGDSKLISRLFCIFVCFEFTISFFLSDRPPPPVQVGVIVIPSQMSQLTPFHNRISIDTASFHDNPDVHYTHTYSSTISPMESNDGVIDDNYRLSYNQTHRCCRTTFQSNAFSISGSNNVITFTHKIVKDS